METLRLETVNELKEIANTQRESVKDINGVEFGPRYPMITIRGRHAYYYSVEKQKDIYLQPPFEVSVK